MSTGAGINQGKFKELCDSNNASNVTSRGVKAKAYESPKHVCEVLCLFVSIDALLGLPQIQCI